MAFRPLTPFVYDPKNETKPFDINAFPFAGINAFPFAVRQVIGKTSQSGNDMMVVQLIVFYGEKLQQYNIKEYLVFTPGGMTRVNQFLRATKTAPQIGQEPDWDIFERNTVTGWCTMRPEQYEDKMGVNKTTYRIDSFTEVNAPHPRIVCQEDHKGNINCVFQNLHEYTNTQYTQTSSTVVQTPQVYTQTQVHTQAPQGYVYPPQTNTPPYPQQYNTAGNSPYPSPSPPPPPQEDEIPF